MFKLSILEKESIKTGEISDELFEKTLEHLSRNNLIPYGIEKARTGDPYSFCYDWLDTNYNAGNEFDE
jgi:hypothetical protein